MSTIASEEDTLNLTACLHVAKRLALEAGKMQEEVTSATMNVQSKGGIDLVTAVDQACEKHIFEALRQEFPSHKFIGEESAAEVVLGNEPTWCVDPVDGTTNFVHSFPMFCVSIGLFVNRAPVLGVIYDPSRKEMYHAITGAGAFVNNVAIQVDHASTDLSQAFVCTNFGHSRKKFFSRLLFVRYYYISPFDKSFDTYITLFSKSFAVHFWVQIFFR